MDAKSVLNAMLATIAEFRRDNRVHGNGLEAIANGNKIKGMLDLAVKMWSLVYDIELDQAELHVIERVDDIFISLVTD